MTTYHIHVMIISSNNIKQIQKDFNECIEEKAIEYARKVRNSFNNCISFMFYKVIDGRIINYDIE